MGNSKYGVLNCAVPEDINIPYTEGFFVWTSPPTENSCLAVFFPFLKRALALVTVLLLGIYFPVTFHGWVGATTHCIFFKRWLKL